MGFKMLPFHPMATVGSFVVGLPTDYFDVGDYTEMEVNLEVWSGYGTDAGLVVEVQTSPDLKGWYGLSSFATVNAPAGPVPQGEKLHLTGFQRYVRATITIEGNGEPYIFTFSVLGVPRR